MFLFLFILFVLSFIFLTCLKSNQISWIYIYIYFFLHYFKTNFSAAVASKNTLYVLMNSHCCLLAIVAKSELLWDHHSSNPHKHCRCHDGGRHRSVPLVYSLRTVSLTDDFAFQVISSSWQNWYVSGWVVYSVTSLPIFSSMTHSGRLVHLLR